MSIQKSQMLSTQSSKLNTISKSGARSSSGCLSFLELQQARDKEKEIYESFRGHANILELINVYELLKNSKVSPDFINAWMWCSWRKEETKKSDIEGEVGEGDHLEGKVGKRVPLKAKVPLEGGVGENGLLVKEVAYPQGEGKAYLGMNVYYYGTYARNCNIELKKNL